MIEMNYERVQDALRNPEILAQSPPFSFLSQKNFPPMNSSQNAILGIWGFDILYDH